MVMSMGAVKNRKTYVVADGVLPQTLSVLRMRAKGFGIKVVVGNPTELVADSAIAKDLCGVLVQYPDVDGGVQDWAGLTAKVHELGGQVTAATDLLALTMLKVCCSCRSHRGISLRRIGSTDTFDLNRNSRPESGALISSWAAQLVSVSRPATGGRMPLSLLSVMASSARCLAG